MTSSMVMRWWPLRCSGREKETCSPSGHAYPYEDRRKNVPGWPGLHGWQKWALILRVTEMDPSTKSEEPTASSEEPPSPRGTASRIWLAPFWKWALMEHFSKWRKRGTTTGTKVQNKNRYKGTKQKQNENEVVEVEEVVSNRGKATIVKKWSLCFSGSTLLTLFCSSPFFESLFKSCFC